MRKTVLYRAGVAIGTCAWLVLVGSGFRTLWLHTYTPGPQASLTSSWPAGVPRDTTRPTLIMLVHPECACSQTSVGELARLLARTATLVDVRVMFLKVGGAEDPRHSLLWHQVMSVPGVRAELDDDGGFVGSFGALVSGHTMLFDRDGALLFAGGITPARAHAGDNDGARSILAALNTGRVPLASTPVFGCLLNTRVAS